MLNNMIINQKSQIVSKNQRDRNGVVLIVLTGYDPALIANIH